MKITKKVITLTAISVLAICGLALAYYFSVKDNTSSTKTTGSETSTEKQQPSSEDQKTEVDKKATPPQNQTQQSSPSNSIKTVTPIITSWGQSENNIEVVARVPGIIEDGGTCTLKMTRGSNTVTGSRKGVSNVSEVSCGYIAIPRSKLSAGNWTTTVSYSSSKAKGNSAPEVVSVQ